MKTTTRYCLHPAHCTCLLPLRWCPCWYGRAPVKRQDAGSIPAAAAQESREPFARKRVLFTEVIRPDEEPVLKTGGGFEAACGFESHGFRSKNDS